MPKVLDKKTIIVGKIESINQGEHFCNTTIVLEDKTHLNIKLTPNDAPKLKLGKIYQFEVLGVKKEEDIILRNLSYKSIEDLVTKKELAHYYSVFYDSAPLPVREIKQAIEDYIEKIENPILKDITKIVYQKFESEFYMHPAATRFHHAYIGGLSYHTLTMLNMIDPLVEIYSYLDRDLLYAGAVLHDISKIDEISGVDGEYTKEGQLIGHLVLGALEVDRVAILKGYQDSEEVLLLKHMILAHHGQLLFGSPKKPQIGEALLLWYIDSIDSKFTVLGEELQNTRPGEFTGSIAVLDKIRFYKTKKKNK